MPVIKIQTAIPQEEYKKFKRKAEQLKLKDYALAQEAIIVFINEPSKAQVRRALYKLVKLFEDDLKDLGQDMGVF